MKAGFHEYHTILSYVMLCYANRYLVRKASFSFDPKGQTKPIKKKKKKGTARAMQMLNMNRSTEMKSTDRLLRT